MTPVVIRRSAFRMWTFALMGIPLVVLAVDVVTRRRMTNALREILFRPESTQIFEPRDVIWAWVMLLCGVILVGFGLKELMFPTTVVEANSLGLRVKVSGPLRPSTVLPWDAVDDLGSGSVADEGDRLPVMWIRLFKPDLLPVQPWGARWIDERTIALLTADWDRSAVKAAEEITRVAMAAVSSKSPGEPDGEVVE
jgi:hypothetical protein